MKNTILKNPALQFVLLGAGLFWLHSFSGPADPAFTDRTIIMKEKYLEKLKENFEETYLRETSAEEYALLKQEAVTHEVLYREALQRNLDKGDEIIRRHLIQKMHFLLDAQSRPDAPSEEELIAWWENHKENYTKPQSFSFHQVFLQPGSGKTEQVKTRLEQGIDDPAGAYRIGDSFLRGYNFRHMDKSEVAAIFGIQALENFNAGNAGTWTGPVTTVYGEHFFYIEKVVPERTLHISEVRASVYADLMKQKAANSKQQAIQELTSKYDIVSNDSQSVAVN